ncbi:putative glycogen synthase kinase mutation revertant [Phaeomoniella chlamydospora]|uniref:Putative glycogen synthase kinase mutation revertant n=1 Tax=Phaeomoniella chlamydospora TaxID=158046 RepID=A0A0G2EYC2_PHACM|nr:putative glycogen synthase kinase mutation revertant [Phaeomoniella chlamydospora]
MDTETQTATFDGEPAKFGLENETLQVEVADHEPLVYKTDAIIAITDGDSQRSFGMHLFNSKDAKDWRPKNLVYERHSVTGLPPSLVQQLHVPVNSKSLQLSNKPSNFSVWISTYSGTGEAVAFYENALQPLLAAFGAKDYQRLETSSAESIKEFCNEILVPRANAGIDQTVILLSGDGGPVDMINALAEGLDAKSAQIPHLALLPLGTGNALSHSSGLTKDMTVGVRSMLNGVPLPIPTFCVTLSPGSKLVTDEGRGREDITALSSGTTPKVYGAVVCSWGFHASLVADSDTAEYRKFGAERFRMAAEQLLSPEPHVYKGKVSVRPDSAGTEAPWKEIGELEHAYTLLTSVSNLEQTFTISPASNPFDGQLRLVHFGPVSSEAIMKLMMLAYQGGKHVDDPAVNYEAVRAMRIEFMEDEERWRRVCIDGKIIAVEKGGWIEVEPGRTVLKLLGL